MLPHQLQYAHSKFRSMVETSSGNEFEKLFHQLMEYRYSDYVPIRTHGNLGDLGGDGLRTKSRTLYACYAPEIFEVSRVQRKFRGDVESAITKRSEQFTTFVFVHNDQRGIHPVISGELVTVGDDHPDKVFEQMGPRKLWNEAMRLARVELEDLLGAPIPVEHVVYSIGMAEIEPLLKHLAEHRDHHAAVEPIPLPTTYKVDYNRLSVFARDRLQAGRRYAHLIEAYYRNVLDLRERDEVAADFREYYRRMRRQHGDDTDEIFWEMQCYVLGQAAPRWDRDDAAKAVLAYFFDECDIFEVPPPGWQPTKVKQGGMA